VLLLLVTTPLIVTKTAGVAQGSVTRTHSLVSCAMASWLLNSKRCVLLLQPVFTPLPLVLSMHLELVEMYARMIPIVLTINFVPVGSESVIPLPIHRTTV